MRVLENWRRDSMIFHIVGFSRDEALWIVIIENTVLISLCVPYQFDCSLKQAFEDNFVVLITICFLVLFILILKLVYQDLLVVNLPSYKTVMWCYRVSIMMHFMVNWA